MILGCLGCGVILDYFGRKASHTIMNIPAIVGWLCIAFGNNNTLILVGRFLTGICSGVSRPVSLVYIGEISDPKLRSICLLMPALITNAGVIIIHVIGKYFHWRISCFLCVIPSVLCVVSFIFLKDSPLWLISRGRVEEGMVAFTWFRGEDEKAVKELENVLDKRRENSDEYCKIVRELLSDRTLLKPFVTVFFLMLCTQSSGVNVLPFYAENIFNETFSGKVDGYTLMIVSDILRAVGTLTVCVFAKVLPKKKTFLTCCFGVIASLGALLLLYFFNTGDIWAPFVFFVFFIIFGGVVITLGWTFMPEILPNNVRGIGTAIASAIGYIVLFTIVKVLPDVLEKYGEAALYASFAVSILICSTVLSFILPETKDRTLQSIENDYTECSFNTKL
ncbi:facilitated trehalose transporter Tret1-like [Manduca sexta]|uniref:facilitated trehalose transporter Tret1-like n=1 Tax=Manduca sexta TaxID=7130 RepID=UPI00188E38BB|nr:facilitated trehalose transporter Tret1-like [Manduca sexta]